VQAAGRIHRLGQTKDIFITRYAFRDSIEQATATLHEKVKSGDIKVGWLRLMATDCESLRVIALDCLLHQVRDGQFPPEAHALFKSHGASQTLFRVRGAEKRKIVQGDGLLDWEGALKRPVAKKGEPPIVLAPSRWERRCTEEECRLCAVRLIASLISLIASLI
jgi:hypothetical protein